MRAGKGQEFAQSSSPLRVGLAIALKECTVPSFTVLGFLESLRKASFNSALSYMLPSSTGRPMESDFGVGDGSADAVANALLIVTPEYNNSIPGVVDSVRA